MDKGFLKVLSSHRTHWIARRTSSSSYALSTKSAIENKYLDRSMILVGVIESLQEFLWNKIEGSFKVKERYHSEQKGSSIAGVTIRHSPVIAVNLDLIDTSAKLVAVLTEVPCKSLLDDRVLRTMDHRDVRTSPKALLDELGKSVISITCKNKLQLSAVLRTYGSASYEMYHPVMDSQWRGEYSVIYKLGSPRPEVVAVDSIENDGYERIDAIDLLAFSVANAGSKESTVGTVAVPDNNKEEGVEMKSLYDVRVKKLNQTDGSTEVVELLGVVVTEINHSARSVKLGDGRVLAGCVMRVRDSEPGGHGYATTEVDFEVVDRYAEGSEKHRKLEDLKALIVSTTIDLVNSPYGSEEMEQYRSDLKSYEEEWKRLSEEKNYNRYALEVVDGDR